MSEQSKHYQILIVGGGTGGITVAARLMLANPDLEVGLVEPSSKHYYQPLWTLVGGGVFPKEETEREEADYIPAGVDWIQDYVVSFQPADNQVSLKSGQTLSYDYLVVSTGMQLDWDKIPGLKENIGKNGVCSNYSYNTAEYTWELVRQFKGGKAIFTQPSTPIKCGGAPQKAMYLSEDYFRTRSKVRGNTDVAFRSGLGGIFGVAKYKAALEKVLQRKEITNKQFQTDLIAIDGAKQEATFKNLATGEEHTEHYDMIHVVPHMGTPDFVRKSPLVDPATGFITVDQHTTQHTQYKNIFALGDSANFPTARTGAAIRKQAPVLVENLLALMQRKPMKASYNGYSSCPLVTGYGSLILAEFDYNSVPVESFPFNQAQERFSMYMLKAYGLPKMYWHGMLRGQL